MNAITFEEIYFMRELVLASHPAEGLEFSIEHNESLGAATVTIARHSVTGEYFLNVVTFSNLKSHTYSVPSGLNAATVEGATWLYEHRYLPIVHKLANEPFSVNQEFHTMHGLWSITQAAAKFVTLADNWRNLASALLMHLKKMEMKIQAMHKEVPTEDAALMDRVKHSIRGMSEMMAARSREASLKASRNL